MNRRAVPEAAELCETISGDHEPPSREGKQRTTRFRDRFWRWVHDRQERQVMRLSRIAIVVAGWVGRKRRSIGPEGCEIMLTGRFDSDNWILAHLGPLAVSKGCSRLWMVSTRPISALPKVESICPPRYLIRVFGATPARLLTFAWAAICKRPHVVGGFHLIYNGVVAAIVARLAGARSMYICVGGTEVANGGIADEENCFNNLRPSSRVAAKRRLKVVSSFDTIITMGTRAASFFRSKGIDADPYVVPGGIDSRRFRPTEEPRTIDVVLTARLTLVKRIDIFLQTIRFVADRVPAVRSAIIGDGELRSELQGLARQWGISDNVAFVGHCDDVERWLRRSKVFVLTSDLEGLPLSAMEAMMCGVPVVASQVGDLGDLVKQGVNGYLVPRRSPEALAECIVSLLSDPTKWRAFSRAAYHSALRFELQATARRWDHILAEFQSSGRPVDHDSSRPHAARHSRTQFAGDFLEGT
jgi:glycosyltransferase involved in cell wall biosynthesis